MIFNEDRTFCSYCLESFKNEYIKCSECRNVSLCLICFGYGVQGGSHKRNHPYSIQICKLVSKVFNISEWGPDEELKLLKATELYGIGNWNDIASKVESHSANECRDHYIMYYINGSIGKYLLSESPRSKCRVLDHSINYTETIEMSKLSPSLYDIMPPCNLNPDDQVILGYMPKRNDFERDYDNDAESILCRLKPDFFKDELLDALKVAHVGIYTQRLKERQRRKLIAREHDLISPIMACVLNKKWKPLQSDDNFSDDIENRNKPFKILSSNSLTPTKGKIRRQSKNLTQKILISPIKKIHTDESSRNKPYDAFMINDSFKPFLRYLKYSQGKALLENLHREEIIKHEISTIIDALKRGRRRVLEVPFRYPTFSNIFIKSRPRFSALFENGKSPLLYDYEVSESETKSKHLNLKTNSKVTSVKKIRKRRKFKCYSFGIKR